MFPTTARFYNPAGPDRLAAVAVQRSTDPNYWLIEVRRGVNAFHLRPHSTQGPYTPEQVGPQFKEITTTLRAEGFFPAGVPSLLDALNSASTGVRARAALRLGWRRERSAVDRLLALLPSAVDETCSLVDALGMIGDMRAILALRQQAERKLLSRRRSAVEALRQIGDAEGLAQARQRAFERLPDAVRQRVEADHVSVPSLVEAVLSLEAQQQGLAADTLYELATPESEEAARQILQKFDFAEAHRWRYVKSVLKRALLRHDYTTFGLLADAVESRGWHSAGTVASVKSGYDGQLRSVRIFGKATQKYLRRSFWRYLVDVARYRPELYSHAAAEALVHAGSSEGTHPPPASHPNAPVRYLYHRILYGGGKRLLVDTRRMRLRFTKVKAPAGAREEAFPHLWDAEFLAYLRILSAARLPEAHVFAVAAVTQRHPDLVQSATPADLVGMLRAPYEPTVELALKEVERRFDPAAPDWALLEMLIHDGRPLAQQIGQRWLRLTAMKWIGDAGKLLTFLTAAEGETRDLVFQLSRSRIASDEGLRRALADLVAVALDQPETKPGTHDALARLARESLAKELEEVLSVERLLGWATHGSPTAKALAGQLLELRPQAASELGLERLVGLAQHEVASVRAAAAALLNASLEGLRADPSVLFVLVESDWEDTREAAFELLRKLDPAALGLDGLMGLLDSNRVEVQQVGQDIATAHFGQFPVEEMVYRLLQHPHAAMRRFTLDLVVNHLPSGEGPLAKLRDFCRAALLDVWPQREVKRGVVAFLRARGLEDERQAALVSSVLGDQVRVQGRADFERALETLVRIEMAFPEVPSTVKVLPEGLT